MLASLLYSDYDEHEHLVTLARQLFTFFIQFLSVVLPLLAVFIYRNRRRAR
jgi:hypothetical protein